MAPRSIVFFLVFISFGCGRAQPRQSSHSITPGSSLFPTTQPSSWISPSKRFAFGFFQLQGTTGFTVGIWLVGNHNTTVVWTAIRDYPAITSDARLDFTKDGLLLLTSEGGQQKLNANPTGSVSYAAMLDSGNFVLYDKDSKIVWQSFQHPTDTILGGQTLFSGGQLFSSLNKSDHSTRSRFHLKMQDDGNLVLYPTNTGDTPGDAYWSSNTFGHGSKLHLYLNDTGILLIINGTSLQKVSGGTIYDASSSSVPNNSIIYRSTLASDGIFRFYSHSYDGSGDFNVSTLWEALTDPCEVKAFCSFNSYCTFNDNKAYCRCLPGTDFVDPNDWSLGCERNFSEAECTGGKENKTLYHIQTIENMKWGGRPYVEALMSTVEECHRSCLEDCNCGAALFKEGSCKKQSLPLRYVRRGKEEESTGIFKVGITSLMSSNETDNQKTPHEVTIVRKTTAIVQILLVTFGFTALSCVGLAISGFFVFKSRVLRYQRLLENGNLGANEEVTLRLFSYNELKRATNGFKAELGKGSFGAVYKGALYKGRRLVAVKRLEKLVEEGEREFQAEMRAIGRTHHRNLVRLLGYCAEGSKRLLVYEYMSNGSLADLLFRADRRPDWDERVRIARDVARGILYLHEECEAPIIHCDIKPQNILMDDFWTAKISDFGLAKFLMPDQTRTFTGIRGTRGYLAPEWYKNTPISVRADVYSYGMVLLEILCCRKNIELNVSNNEEVVLSTWIYKCFVGRELDKIVHGEEVDKTALENMVKLGLWCIQDEPALRPSMKSVLLMLEGITEISIPPCPAATSM
ncbi:G-type lectin S-receptor-like serine/threonine-protein kinase LECRK1 [Corylus avellana]|uniref:G-type lectin S-receptor-like serine/threonine-protein kinase LECRK1 n=1 Tax=Corylus avellana TaxID=13451 RepID=UPI001E1FF0EB|nr:G-type lectin S-receptor-like serine/threonine-protein kinase LECRK1 [Corylus avellana]